MKVLETERLWLRPFTPEDAEDLHRVVYSDPDVCRFYCSRTKTLEEVRENVRFRVGQLADDAFGFLTVRRKEGGVLLGLVALQSYLASWIVWKEAPDSPYHTLEVELSYALGSMFQKQGYATEACRAVIDYGFQELRLKRIAYAVAGDNTNSWRLMERLGFHLSRSSDSDGVVGVLVNTVL